MGRPKGSGRSGARGRGTNSVGRTAAFSTENGVNGYVSPTPSSHDVAINGTTPKNTAAVLNKTTPRNLAHRPPQPFQANLRSKNDSAVDIPENESTKSVVDRDSPITADEDGPDSAANSDSVSFLAIRGKRAGPGRPPKKGRGRGRGRGDVAGIRGNTPAGRGGGPGSRGGKGAYSKARKFADLEDDLDKDLPLSADVDVNVLRPDCNNFALPPMQRRTIRYSARLNALPKGGDSDAALEMAEDRQSELVTYFRELGKVMVDQNMDRTKESYRAIQASDKIQEAVWYQMIQHDLVSHENKRIADIEKFFNMATNSADSEYVASKGYINKECEVEIVDATDDVIRYVIRQGGGMNDFISTGDNRILHRILKKTHLENVEEVTREDLILAFETPDGKDRTRFDLPQMRTRSNRGLHDRKALPTGGANLRQKVAEWYNKETNALNEDSPEVLSEALRQKLRKHDEVPETIRGALAGMKETDTFDYTEVTRKRKDDDSRKRSMRQRKRRKSTPDHERPIEQDEISRFKIPWHYDGPDREESDYDQELIDTYIIGSKLYELRPNRYVRDWGHNLENPAQFWPGEQRSTREHDAIHALLSLSGNTALVETSFGSPVADDSDATDIAVSDSESDYDTDISEDISEGDAIIQPKKPVEIEFSIDEMAQGEKITPQKKQHHIFQDGGDGSDSDDRIHEIYDQQRHLGIEISDGVFSDMGQQHVIPESNVRGDPFLEPSGCQLPYLSGIGFRSESYQTKAKVLSREHISESDVRSEPYHVETMILFGSRVHSQPHSPELNEEPDKITDKEEELVSTMEGPPKELGQGDVASTRPSTASNSTVALNIDIVNRDASPQPQGDTVMAEATESSNGSQSAPAFVTGSSGMGASSDTSGPEANLSRVPFSKNASKSGVIRAREPPRKKRGRPRDAKPGFTFRVSKQRVDTTAAMNISASSARNRGGSLTVLQPPPALAPYPELPVGPSLSHQPFYEHSSVSISAYPPTASQQTFYAHPMEQQITPIYNHDQDLIDDGSGWPRSFTHAPAPLQAPPPPYRISASPQLMISRTPRQPMGSHKPQIIYQPVAPQTMMSQPMASEPDMVIVPQAGMVSRPMTPEPEIVYQPPFFSQSAAICSPRSDSAPPIPLMAHTDSAYETKRYYVGGGKYKLGPAALSESRGSSRTRSVSDTAAPVDSTDPSTFITNSHIQLGVPPIEQHPDLVDEEYFESMLYGDDDDGDLTL